MINDIYKAKLSYFFMPPYYKQDINQDIDDEKMSRINSAGIINITIENLWRDVYSSMAKADLVVMNRKLDAIWAILGGDVEENSDKDKEFMKMEEKLYETGNLNHKKTGFETSKKDEGAIIAKQYLLLRKKALFLRRLQNEQGKGTAYVSADEDDFD